MITLEGASTPEVEATLERLAAEDVLGQLLRREGRMATLGTEGGDVKLDWVDGVERALDHPQALQAAAEEGAATLRQGHPPRHLVGHGGIGADGLHPQADGLPGRPGTLRAPPGQHRSGGPQSHPGGHRRPRRRGAARRPCTRR